ncbi:MAG: AAA family ATPase [Candidatus Delongbacteria bacterium]|nr:AAA family ATPase [Candidatus Delongbacteria bacterium]
MQNIDRDIKKLLLNKINSGKVLVLLGARRVGKTFLLKQILKEIKEEYLFVNGENINIHLALEHRSIENYKQFLGNKKLLVIDEAQKIPEIGNILKLMIDEIEGLKIIITGPSAFDIHNMTGEPLTGRKYTYMLYPFSENEFNQIDNPIAKKDMIKHRMIYGNYPELINLPDITDKKEYLNEIINSYLLKDILAFENIKNSSKIHSILRLIAFQIGKEVSYHEIGRQLSMSKNTVEKYLDLLSKVFIVFKVEGFSRNLRKEISKSPRWYFYDNGIRNTLIANFNNLDLRNDVGQLWENYAISERIKYQNVNRMIVNNYFWRTYDQQEIDWIEERGGVLHAYEFKWNKKKSKVPVAWAKTYTQSKFKIITPENFQDWIK